MAQEERQRKEILQQSALKLLQAVEAISHGDLTIQAEVTEDEIGTIADCYNVTTGKLRRIIVNVKDTATEVIETTTGNEISVQELAEEVTRQTAEISTALSQFETMTDAIQEVATTAEQAEILMQQTRQVMAEGDVAMNQTVASFQLIQSTVQRAEQK